MTNREWLNSLNDNEYYNKVIMREAISPKCKICVLASTENCSEKKYGVSFEYLAMRAKNCKSGILQWLQAEHKEQDNGRKR